MRKPYHSHGTLAHYKITATLHHPTAHKGTRAGGYWFMGEYSLPAGAGRLIGGMMGAGCWVLKKLALFIKSKAVEFIARNLLFA